MTATNLWQTALDDLRQQLTRSTYDTWLEPTRALTLDAETETLVVSVPSDRARDWLVSRLGDPLAEALAAVAGRAIRCVFLVQEPTVAPPTAPREQVGADPTAEGVGSPSRNGTRFEQRALTPQPTQRFGVPGGPAINPRYTFDTFVVGAGNRLAHAATQAVAEFPAQRYNPLFIYGGVGLGKTHLLHAIGHAAVARGLSVLAVSSEKFTNDLINAIRTQSTEEFRSVYRAADMLLIDDIHFIAGKESTQEEFFHTFNAIHGADGQIVLTSDRPPQSISTLEDRLRSRFQWGLQVDIEPPDLETRIAILRAKNERQGGHVSDPVLEIVAQAVQQNVRELEGALNRVVAYAQSHGLPMNVETAERALSDLMLRRDPPTLDRILDAVAKYYGLSDEELRGRGRAARISEPRQVVMYLMREETDASFPVIGNALGKRDHTTVLHGCDKIGRLVERDAQLRRDIMQIREALYAS
jgi:chromosomal replication initiator protein